MLKRLQDRHGNCAEALTKKEAVDAGLTVTVNPDTDTCDLSHHRREGTRVQNRHNVQVGSRDNTGKDGFLHHT